MENAMTDWLIFGAIIFGVIIVFTIGALVIGIIGDYVIPVVKMNIKEIKDLNVKQGLTDSDKNEPTEEGGRHDRRRN